MVSAGAQQQPTGRYGRRRPRPGLTPLRIQEAGRRVIERDGLDALTMRAVATELGTAPASLYRHLADRGELLQAILEDLASGLPVVVAGSTPAVRLHNRFVAFHDFVAQHVWVLHVLIGGSRVARNALPFTDACLADFRQAGLDLVAAGRAFRVCYQYTLGELLDTHQPAPETTPSPRETIVAGADAGVVPHFTALRDAGGSAVSEQYPVGIDLVIGALLSR